MTLLNAITLYAGGGNTCVECGRHEAFGKFLPTSKARRITVNNRSKDINAFSARQNNAMMHRFTADENLLLYIEQVNHRRAWSVLMSRTNGNVHELERLEGVVQKVRQHVESRFGVKIV